MRRKLRIRRKDIRYMVVVGLLSTVFTSGVAYSVLNAGSTQAFYAMWILGSSGRVDDYYPHNDPNIGVGENVNWTLGVYNHMGGIQYVVIRVKLLNSTQESPNDLTGLASPVLPLLEFRRVLVDNETWSVPFVWALLNTAAQGGTVLITGLSANSIIFTGDLSMAVSGLNFRFVFELWFYDIESHELSFSWQAEGTKRSAWTQIWFNATQTG